MIDKSSQYQILSDLRRDELKAFTQYMSCGYYLKGQGLECLGDNVHKLAAQELEHAEELAARMQELDLWVPADTQTSDLTIDSIEYCLSFLVQAEEETISKYDTYSTAVVGDAATYKVIEHIIAEEWQHRSYFVRALTAFRQGGYNALLNKSVARYTESEE